MQIAGYQVLETLAEGEKSNVYLAQAAASEQRVVIKISVPGAAARASELMLRNEFEMTRDGDSLLQPIDWQRLEQGSALMRPYVQGTAWGQWVRIQQPDFGTALRLAALAAAQLDALHRRGVIHKDIHPSNLIVGPGGQSVTLIDYAVAARLDLRANFAAHAGQMEGALAYLSPEQTGRMNRTVDYRCDLYSLGAVLYELFTGQPPFRAAEPLELMHSHLARTPAPLTALQPALPPVLSRIVLKLLAKNAEDRYQSAARLQTDLETCLRQWETQGQIADFDIAQHDAPLRFRIPQKLYGRDAERAELLAAFERAASGRKHLALVGGWSGVGKTALVFDVHIPVTERRGLFLAGKFEQFKRNVPYLAWRQAFDELTEQVLTEGPDGIAQWRRRIVEALGDLTGVVTSLVPSLEKIVGPQPAPPALPAAEVQNRFNYAFRSFVRVISTREHPLVIFLDDFQWADAASLNLLRLVMTEPGLGYLLIIGAYRENEVHDGHPFFTAVENLEKEWLAINETDTSLAFAPDNVLISRASVGNLSENDLHQLVADTLDMEPSPSAAINTYHLPLTTPTDELAHLIFQKTRGNAYFVHRFLESLHADGHIRLERRDGRTAWTIRTDDIRSLRITDNVADLLARKVEKMQPDARQSLDTAACLGHTFDLGTLAAITQRDPETVEASLWEAIEEGLLTPLNPDYRFFTTVSTDELALVRFSFAHDRVRQAIYDALPAAKKHGLHRQAALLMLQDLSEAEQAERVFEIANHLNEVDEVDGVDKVDEVDETSAGGTPNRPSTAVGTVAAADFQLKALKIRLNFEAGMKAKASAAYEPAFNFFQNALAALPSDAWQTDYPRTLQLHSQTAETAYLSGHDDDMEQLLDVILKNARTPLDKVMALEIRTNAYFVRLRTRESIAVGLEALALLGMKLPNKPNQAQVVLELVKTKAALRSKKPEQLLDLPLMKRPEDLAVMRIMANMAPAVFFVDTNQFAILMFRKMVFTVQHGICSSTAYAFSAYGFVLCGVTNEVDAGSIYGQVTLALMRLYPFSQYQARGYFSVYYFIDHWKKPLGSILPDLRAAYQHSLETGEADFTSFLGNAYSQACIISGYDLEETDKELRRQLQYSTLTRQLTSVMFNNLFHQFVLCLRNQSHEPQLLRGEMCDSDALMAEMRQSGNAPVIFNIGYFQSQLSLLFGHYGAAAQQVEVAEEHLKSVISIPVYKHHALLSAVARHHVCLENKALKNKHLGKIKDDIADLKKYQKHCAADFDGKVALAEASLHSVLGEHDKALARYNEAVSHFARQSNAYDQAVGYLEFFRYARSRDFDELAVTYHRKAVSAFRRWGAEAVALYLEAMPGYAAQSDAAAVSPVGMGARREVDMFSIVKGSQLISSELDLLLLVPKMLGVMAENAGAERGALILTRKNGHLVEAEMREAGAVQNLDPALPYDQYEGVSAAVVNYVLHSGQNVVLDNALAEGRFVNDSYIRAQRVRSLLCMNLLHKGQTVGVLYLENNLVPGAFTAGRMEVLQILGTQAAISIENAKYYADIQALNRSYERFVPQEFLQQLGRQSILDIALGDQAVRDMAVMFSDIWGFTGISESVSTEEVFALLNDIWGRFTPVIEANGGIIDKFIGDAVMALFPSSAQQALQAAVEIQRKLSELNAERESAGLFPIRMGIGLNTGKMILGTVGASSRLDTTVIGDAVNVSARLEDMTRELNTNLIVSADLVEKLRDPGAFRLRCVGTLPLRGKTQGLRIFEEFSNDAPALAALKLQHQAAFEQVVAAAERGDRAAARQLAAAYLQQVPEDAAAGYYGG
jgi:predicted ATPase/class 3 adenylate cyclase